MAESEIAERNLANFQQLLHKLVCKLYQSQEKLLLSAEQEFPVTYPFFQRIVDEIDEKLNTAKDR